MQRALLLALVSLVVSATFIACGDDAVESAASPSESPPEAPPEPPDQTGDEAALDRARALAKGLGGGLKTRLVEAMAEGGPAAAIRVCADEAQEITDRVAGEGEAVGRASTKLRNPDNEGPAWVNAWLSAQGDAPASDATPLARVEEGHARVILPIPVDGVCLSCHGEPGQLSPEVSAVLTERYPSDQATGYREGDLRGALWAEVSVSR